MQNNNLKNNFYPTSNIKSSIFLNNSSDFPRTYQLLFFFFIKLVDWGNLNLPDHLCGSKPNACPHEKRTKKKSQFRCKAESFSVSGKLYSFWLRRTSTSICS